MTTESVKNRALCFNTDDAEEWRSQHVICRVLEDIQNRACRSGLPPGTQLTEFTDYLRNLYPEYYIEITPDI